MTQEEWDATDFADQYCGGAFFNICFGDALFAYDESKCECCEVDPNTMKCKSAENDGDKCDPNPDNIYYDPFTTQCIHITPVFMGGLHWTGGDVWLDGGFDLDWQRIDSVNWADGVADGDLCTYTLNGVEVDYGVSADVFQSTANPH